MEKHLRLIFLSLLLVLSVSAVQAQTAAQILRRASAKVMKSGSVSAEFTYSGAGHNGTGSLTASGRKFKVSTPGFSAWYDGTNLWTYAVSSKETTLVHPSASELAETNPLLYLSSAAGGNCSFAKGDSKVRRVITVTPKSRKEGYRSATVELNGKTLLPSRITVKSTDGSTVSVNIRRITLGKALPASNFTYPKNKYPKIKIIDLR